MGRNATTTPNRTSETRATIGFIGSLASPHESCRLACYRSDSTILWWSRVITSGLRPTTSARLPLLCTIEHKDVAHTF